MSSKKPSPKRSSQFKVKSKRSTKNKVRQFVIAIGGAHGVGKTTVYDKMVQNFSETTLLQFFPELGLNPPYPLGSKDQNVAFKSEIHFIQQMGDRNIRVKRLLQNNVESIVVLDRSPISVLVYSSALNIPKKDFDMIERAYNDSFEWVPETFIYLEAKPETIMKRIVHRGSLDPERLKWNEDDLNYLKKILANYEYYFKKLGYEKNNRLIRINTENKTIDEVYREVINAIEVRTGLPLYKRFTMPVSQMTLESFWAGGNVESNQNQ